MNNFDNSDRLKNTVLKALDLNKAIRQVVEACLKPKSLLGSHYEKAISRIVYEGYIILVYIIEMLLSNWLIVNFENCCCLTPSILIKYLFNIIEGVNFTNIYEQLFTRKCFAQLLCA